MPTGAITSGIDVAQLVLYAFWIFFAGLIIYLRREDKREGYPLESDRSGGRVIVQGFPAMPPRKTFQLTHGGTYEAGARPESARIAAEPIGGWPGAPLEPTGDPMVDGVGPAAYAQRADTPELTVDGATRIVPLRLATGFSLEARDPDPRGMAVIGADGATGAVVTDVWVDRSDMLARYLEVEVAADGARRHVLLPVPFARIQARRGVLVQSILARHFALVPATRSPDQVTLREEDRISAFYASGHLYATPSRLGPLL